MRQNLLFSLLVLSGCQFPSKEPEAPTPRGAKLWWQLPCEVSDVAPVQTKSSWLVNTTQLKTEDYPVLKADEIVAFPPDWKPQPKVVEKQKEEPEPKGAYY